MRRPLRLVALAVLAAGAATSEGAPPPLYPVRLMVHWRHQAQFAGYYVALAKGLYQERVLDVTIIRGGPDRDPIEFLTRRETDVATLFLSGALTARDRGVALVHLAQIVNLSNATLVAWKKRAIRSPHDLDGRRVSMWGEQFRAPYIHLFKALGIEPVPVSQYYSVDLFLRHGVDACSAMEYNEVHTIYQAGVDPEEVVVFRLQDLGYGFPEDGLYCLPDFAGDRPELRRAFVEASLAGWRRAAEAPEEALELVMERVRDSHVPTNMAHQRWMLRTILPTIVPRSGETWRLGELSRTDYERTVALLRQRGVVSGAPSYEVFHPEAP